MDDQSRCWEIECFVPFETFDIQRMWEYRGGWVFHCALLFKGSLLRIICVFTRYLWLGHRLRKRGLCKIVGAECPFFCVRNS